MSWAFAKDMGQEEVIMGLLEGAGVMNLRSRPNTEQCILNLRILFIKPYTPYFHVIFCYFGCSVGISVIFKFYRVFRLFLCFQRYFGYFGASGIILVIFWVFELFWSFFEFQSYFGIFFSMIF